ncbi:serine O-acetyltransferase [Aminipila sp.]|uniref:serine O-acetyltransferase n=1 Tax=Aminipila sp. TaxID=2060095 RepID=UPI00289EE7D2|nr:serine O-acetyltransferase [Aminipila sp.]
MYERGMEKVINICQTTLPDSCVSLTERISEITVKELILLLRQLFFFECLQMLQKDKRENVAREEYSEIEQVLNFQMDNLFWNGRAGIKNNAVKDFVKRLPKLCELVKKDLQAAYEGDPAAKSYEEILCSYPGLFAIMIQRAAHVLYELDVPILPRMMTEYAHSKTGIDIHPGARIGEYFFIDHGTGIVIGETAVIGNHVKLYQGVTLGAFSTSGGQKLRDKKRHPTIGDYVTVYSGASILGGRTTIENGATIGCNVMVTASVYSNMKITENIKGEVNDGNKK